MTVEMDNQGFVQILRNRSNVCSVEPIFCQKYIHIVFKDEAGHKITGSCARLLVTSDPSVIQELRQKSLQLHQPRMTAVEIPDLSAVARVLGEIVV